MNKATVISGRVWVIKDCNGNPIDSIDTDMIYHNRYLTITDIAQMGQYTFDNLDGYEDFAKKARQDDIIVTGKNFGCGSSRQQAVDCFKSLGVTLVLAESFGAIYERNAINAAMPILTYKPEDGFFNDGDQIEVDIISGVIKNITNGK